MKIATFLHRKFRWVNLPGAILMMLLQRAPALNVVAAADEMIVSSPVGTVLKSVLAAVAALGAVNSMAGATPLTVSAGTASGMTGSITFAAGTAGSVLISLSGANSTAQPPMSWTVTGSIPTGMNYSGLTSSGTTNVQTLHLAGTPTTAGTYVATLQTFSGQNATGNFESGSYTYTVTVTGPANVAPSITTQPSSQTIVAGNPVTFTSGANGTPAPTFQWQKDNVNIPGATSATYNIASVGSGDAGTYKLVATNTAGSATSNGAVLTVNTAPQITQQPSNQTVTAGNPVTFTAAASGTPTPTFQWQKNTVNIPGATSATYNIASAAAGDAGTYRVVATNAVSSATSNGAVLTVNPAAILPNFSQQPLSLVILGGHNAIFTVAATGTPTPTFRWTRQPAGGVAAPINDGGVYAGAATATLTITGATTALNGDQYRCVASNTAGPVTSNAAMLTVTPAATDFNGDGQSDLVWQNANTGERIIWLLNGTTFAASAAIEGVSTDWSIAAVADLNGDNQVDLLWQNTVTGERLVWFMNGTNAIGSVSLGGVPIEWSIACTADFNGDGKPDIVWQNRVTGERLIWGMDGTTYQAGASLGVLPTEWSIAGAGDFNGDGHADLVWSNTRTGEVLLWLMNGTAVNSTVSLGFVSPRYQIAGTGDYNNDTKTDILWTDTLTGERTAWLMNGTTVGSMVTLATLPQEWVLNRPILRTAPVDLNADGSSDLVWQNTATGDRAIWLMSGASYLGSASLGNVPAEWSIAAFGDFNRDGKPDIVWQNSSTGERIIWLMNGTTFLSTLSLATIPPEWSIAGAADFNGDGKPDILWQNTSTGERLIWLMDGTAFLYSASLGIIPTDWWVAGVGDFNGDGKPDILWQNSSTGERLVWFMDGTSVTASASLGVVSTDWSIAGVGDFNLDGQTDIVWQNTTSGDRLVWYMSGLSIVGSSDFGVVPLEWSIRN